MAQVLCLGTVITGLLAGALIGVVTVSTSGSTPVRIVILGGIGFGWCSLSLLCATVVAATGAT